MKIKPPKLFVFSLDVAHMSWYNTNIAAPPHLNSPIVPQLPRKAKKLKLTVSLYC